VVYDRSADAVASLVKDGAKGSSSLAEFVKNLDKPRHLCLMVPAAYVDACVRKGITCAAVTDHNEVRGAFVIQRMALRQAGVN
jgi:6-phosphogluconate dehydrogenase (decarboxylating)